MKAFLGGLTVGLTVGLVFSTAEAGFMDKANCQSGSSYAVDLSDFVNKLSGRLVDCVNYLQDRDTETYNDLVTLFNTVDGRVSHLEKKIELLEDR